MGNNYNVTATRYHDISCGHRVVGHGGKCEFLHGHNYRIHFTCEAEQLDEVGRVIDFGVIKTILCQWLEDNWDHKMLLWEKDDNFFIEKLRKFYTHWDSMGIVEVPFNPTAENMAEHLLFISNALLQAEHLCRISNALPQDEGYSDIVCTEIIVEETRKCSASAKCK